MQCNLSASLHAATPTMGKSKKKQTDTEKTASKPFSPNTNQMSLTLRMNKRLQDAMECGDSQCAVTTLLSPSNRWIVELRIWSCRQMVSPQLLNASYIHEHAYSYTQLSLLSQISDCYAVVAIVE